VDINQIHVLWSSSAEQKNLEKYRSQKKILGKEEE
jgi:hypothetical protein